MKQFERMVQPIDVEVDDDGQSMTIEFGGEDGGDDSSGLFVHVKSWSDKKQHDEFNKLVGKRVRVTVEVIKPS